MWILRKPRPMTPRVPRAPRTSPSLRRSLEQQAVAKSGPVTRGVTLAVAVEESGPVTVTLTLALAVTVAPNQNHLHQFGSQEPILAYITHT